MTPLPDEIWTDILDYLDPTDVIASQRVSRHLLKLGRDSSLWRNKVFEKAPSATHSHATNPNALNALTGALGGLSLGGPPPTPSAHSQPSVYGVNQPKPSKRARAILEWDRTDSSETIDWYSEYIARYAPLSTDWAETSAPQHEVRGMALFADGERVIGTLDDGSLGIWDVQRSYDGRRRLKQTGKSRGNLLFEDMYSLGEPSMKDTTRPLGATVENISLQSSRRKAFVAVKNILNEVDLDRMEVVSQNQFAWPITALSQENEMDCDLTVGTSFSLHIHDTRLPPSKEQMSSKRVEVVDDSKIAFLANYSKNLPGTKYERYDPQSFSGRLESYARIEPGPLSILHRDKNEIVIAGRMPSIIFYDRRKFPRPRTAIHSGARLSAITSLPFPPAEANAERGSNSTLIACGEYGGRGSLEVYGLPRESQNSTSPHYRFSDVAEQSSTHAKSYSFRNRQEASSSKLLSVATQGSRIVFSDSEGMLKWVERDGRGLARRWNINSFQMNSKGASITGDKVVRKMLALREEPSARGTRGDGDLLIWTGEKIGIVTTKSKPQPWDDHEELVHAFERAMDLNSDDHNEKEKEEEYSTMMRQALERQADERRWMSRFNVRH